MSLALQDTIHRLRAYNDSAFPILTVYFHPILNGHTTQKQLEDYLNQTLLDEDRVQVQQNIIYMSGLMQEYRSKYPDESIAIFSGDNILFEIIHLPFVIEDCVSISHSPDLKPLIAQESTYLRYLIITVDRVKAKFFMMSQGVIENQDEVVDESVPQNIHADSSETTNLTREDKINRHIQDHLHRHFQLIAERVASFVGNTPINGVIIGGHKNLLHNFKRHLPKLLQEKVIGSFVSDVNNNMNDVVEKSKRVIGSSQPAI